MSYLSGLYQELRDIGVEPNAVDLGAVSDYLDAHRERTGQEMDVVEAIKTLYVTIH